MAAISSICVYLDPDEGGGMSACHCYCGLSHRRARCGRRGQTFTNEFVYFLFYIVTIVYGAFDLL